MSEVTFKATCENIRIVFIGNEMIGRIWRNTEGYRVACEEYESAEGMYDSFEAAKQAIRGAVKGARHESIRDFYGDANTGGEPVKVVVEV